MSRNSLASLPPELSQLQVEGLHFSGNKFSEIPSVIFEMNKTLRKLEVDDMGLTSLPRAIGKLTELIHCRLSENRISKLPDELGNLQKLRVFDLSANNLTEISPAAAKMNVEYILRLNDNPKSHLPAEIFNIKGNIDITGTKINPKDYPKAQQARFTSEKKDPRKGKKRK